MFKAFGKTTAGVPIVILGLSKGNTKRLHKGKPILVDLEPLVGVKCQVAIFAGETEEDMQREFLSKFQAKEMVDVTKPIGEG